LKLLNECISDKSHNM